MTQDESIAFFLECEAKRKEVHEAGGTEEDAQEAAKTHWNAWANEILRQKPEIEEPGSSNYNGRYAKGNEAFKAWQSAANINLETCKFLEVPFMDGQVDHEKMHEIEMGEEESAFRVLFYDQRQINFNGYIFPGEANFSYSYFAGSVDFAHSQFLGYAQFSGADFQGSGHFYECIFQDAVFFSDSNFLEQPNFCRARFSGHTSFEEAVFGSGAFFSSASFGSSILFCNASFKSGTEVTQAYFDEVEFNDRVDFENAEFLCSANFDGALFRAQTSFKNARFCSNISFRNAFFAFASPEGSIDLSGIKAERAFDLTRAQFSKVPAFNQADFAQAPDLDDVSYPFPPFFRFWIRGWEDEEQKTKRAEKYKADAAKYRHLRRLAILDHENESKAFKGETRAKRGTEHKPWHAAFWFGLGYDALSDFGRSIMRPLYAWAILTALFAAIYLANAGSTAEWHANCPAPSQ